MNIQPQQIKLLHSLLRSTNLAPQKASLIAGITAGRSESSKDLTYHEAGTLITYLKSQDSAHKMRRRIISMAHEIGWKKKGTKEIDMDAINEWCKKYGYLKKSFMEYTTAELPKLVSQFENGPYKYYLSNI